MPIPELRYRHRAIDPVDEIGKSLAKMADMPVRAARAADVGTTQN